MPTTLPRRPANSLDYVPARRRALVLAHITEPTTPTWKWDRVDYLAEAHLMLGEARRLRSVGLRADHYLHQAALMRRCYQHYSPPPA